MLTMITLEQLNNALDKRFAEQYEDLAGMMARGLTELGDELRTEFRDGIAAATTKWERILDDHIAICRKDYDELAPRVKNLELALYSKN